MAEKSFRFIRNFGWSALSQGGTAVLSFLLLPFIIHRLGVEAYGLYILMNAVSSYLQLFAFGAGAPTIKYTASLTASRSGRALRRLLTYSLAAHGLGVFAGALLLMVGVHAVVLRLFHVPFALQHLAGFVLVCAALGALFFSLSQFSLSILQGLQRFDFSSGIAFLQNALMTLGIAGLLIAGHGLKSVACLYVAVNFFLCILAAAFAFKALRLPREEGPEKLPFRTFASWSLSSWLGPFAWIISNQVDKVFLARAMSLTAVTLYSVPSGLLQRFQTFPSSVSSIVAPMMSELHGLDAEESRRRMYLKSLRFLLWLALPILTLLFVFMPQFLGLWLHGDFGSRSVWPSRLLVLSQGFYLFVVMPHAAVFSRDRPILSTAFVWGQALISLTSWRILALRYGLLGVATGSLLGQALPTLFYLAYVHRLIDLDLGRFLSSVRAPVASALIAAAILFPFHVRATDWLRLSMFVFVGLAVFYGLTGLLMRADERELLSQFLRKLSRAWGAR